MAPSPPPSPVRVSTDVEKQKIDHIEQSEDDSQAVDIARVYSPLEKKLVRKLDFIILPVLWIMYWLNYLDRNAITVARLDGLEEELNLTDTQYSTCVSILFVGYILGQIPSNMLMTRLRPSVFMATAMAVWAIVSTMTGICHDYTGLVLTRFFLGVAEAPFYPGALYMLSIFYDRHEIATRISILFTGNICGTAFSGLIAIGVFQMGGVAGLSGWRWLFILQGIVTFVVAVASAFLLPDEPRATWWLTPEERDLAHRRVGEDTTQLRTNTSTWQGLREACSDKKLWVLVAMQHVHMVASGYKNFFPTIVETLGFGQTATLALTCPPYLIAGAITIAWSWNSGRVNERTWHITWAKVVGIFGFVLACATLNVGARYFAMCCFATGVYACNSIILGWVSTTCGQTREKKATALALVNTVASIGPIYTPYLWPEWDEPRYTIAMATSAAFCLVAAVLAWVMRIMLVRENRKLKSAFGDQVLLYSY